MNSDRDPQAKPPARVPESAPDPPSPAPTSSGAAESAGPAPDTSRAGRRSFETPVSGGSASGSSAPRSPESPPMVPASRRSGSSAPPDAPAASERLVSDVTSGQNREPRPDGRDEVSPEQVREHLRRRANFLRELAEARELRRRVTPHRSRRARIHAALRRRTFRIN